MPLPTVPPKRPFYKAGYRHDIAYPRQISMPERDSEPRCLVHHTDAGPLVRVRILDSEPASGSASGPVAHRCFVPRCYAAPLALLGKKMAFFEALRYASGVPIRSRTGAGWHRLARTDMLEYTYLWRVCVRFVAELLEETRMRRVGAGWRSDVLRGYLHREYARHEHTLAGRAAYWREQTCGGGAAYERPDEQDMDWDAFLEADRKQRGWHAFLWRHISQGYTDDHHDRPQQWLAWLREDLSLARDAKLSFEEAPRSRVDSARSLPKPKLNFYEPRSDINTHTTSAKRRTRRQDGADSGTIDEDPPMAIQCEDGRQVRAAERNAEPAQDAIDESESAEAAFAGPRKRRRVTFVMYVDAGLDFEFTVAGAPVIPTPVPAELTDNEERAID